MKPPLRIIHCFAVMVMLHVAALCFDARGAAGDVDLTFDPGSGVNGHVDTALVQPDGKVLIAGSFTTVNGVVRPKMARIYGHSPPPVSFAAWVADFGLTEAAAAASADPDKDGLPNAAEYVFGGNPAVPATSGSPTPAISGGNMVFTFSRDDASKTPDVTLTVESGADPASWPAVFTIGPSTASSSLGVNVSENGAVPDIITVIIPQGTSTRRYVRLKVTVTS